MGRRWRDSRLWFKKNVDVKAKTVREVRPRIVIRYDVLSVKRQHSRAPLLQLRIDSRLKLLVVPIIKCRVRWVEGGKRLGDVLSNCFRNDRIHREMRIAERVHIAGRARDICWHV